MRGTAVPTRGLVGSRQRPALTSLLCSFRRVSNCSFTCFQYRTSMSAHKDLVRGLPGPAQALPVHLEPWAAPRPRAGRQNTAQNHCSSEGHAHNSDLTCKGRALSPGPPAVGVVSIFKRIWSAGTKPSPCRLYLDPPALAQPPYPPPLTGSQVPLVEVLQLGGTLPLALLSWNLLHAGGHGERPTWGHEHSLGPWGRLQHPHAPGATAPGSTVPTRLLTGTEPTLTNYGCSREPVHRRPREVSLYPITFLERLRVQGVKGVQALPGVWSLLSTEHKQTLQGAGGTGDAHPPSKAH